MKKIWLAVLIVLSAFSGVSTATHECLNPQHIPPEPEDCEIDHAIESTMMNYVDPTMCPVLASQAGTYGLVVINAQGDVFVGGEPQWDCPPYDLWGR